MPCPFPRNKGKIETTIDAWLATRYVKRPSSRIHTADIAHLDLSPSAEVTILFACGTLTEERDEGRPETVNTLDADNGPLPDASCDQLQESDEDVFHVHFSEDDDGKSKIRDLGTENPGIIEDRKCYFHEQAQYVAFLVFSIG